MPQSHSLPLSSLLLTRRALPALPHLYSGCCCVCSTMTSASNIVLAKRRYSPIASRTWQSDSPWTVNIRSQFTDDKLQQLQLESESDPEVTAAIRNISTDGWSDSARKLPQNLRKVWSCKDELSVEDGLVLKGERVPIPTTMRSYILQNIYAGHQGMEKCKLRAKTCVYWKGINAHMECTVKACSVRQTNQSSQQAETHRPLDNPDGLWQVLATDLFHLDGNDYVIVIDYYLKIPFLRRLTSNSTSATVISALKQLFGEHGIPHKLLSDNGPQYDCVEFRTFAADWGFKHVTSSPRYPSPTDLPNAWSRLSRKPCSRQGRAVLIHTSLCCLRNHPHRQQPPLLCRTPLLLAAQIQLPSTLLTHTPRYSCPQEPASPPADAKVVPWLERPWPSTTPTLPNMSTCRKGWCCREEARTAFVHRLHSKRWSLTVVIVASSGTWQHHPNISHGQTRPASTTHPHRTSNNR